MTTAKQAKEPDPAPMLALEKTVSDFEKHFTVIHHYEWTEPQVAKTPTGELYNEYRHGPCADFDAVIASWVASAEAVRQAAPENSALYWRVRPEIAFSSQPSYRGWWIYSRFIISSKPRKI